MGKFSIPPALKWLGWLATLVMAAMAIIMFATGGDGAGQRVCQWRLTDRD